MSAQRGSASLAAVFVSLPVLGLLFSSISWEIDPRRETSEQRFARLSNPRSSFVVDALVNLHETSAARDWDGLFTWQAAELERLQNARKKMEPVVIAEPKETLEHRLQQLEPRTAVEALLKEGGDPNVKLRGGVTPLEAVIYSVNDVKALLEKGADPNGTTSTGATPLKLVCDQCRYQSAVASYNRCLEQHLGTTSLCVDERNQMVGQRTEDVRVVSIIEILIAKGANPRSVLRKEFVPLESASDQPKDITLIEYARRLCPDFVIKALTGKAAKADEPESPAQDH